MPYWPPPPKSACRKRFPPLEIDAMYASERGSTGRLETSWFQGLSAGKTGQPPTVGAASVLAEPTARTSTATGTQRRMKLMFWTYLIIIFAGLSLYWYIGLTHQ